LEFFFLNIDIGHHLTGIVLAKMARRWLKKRNRDVNEYVIKSHKGFSLIDKGVFIEPIYGHIIINKHLVVSKVLIGL